MVGEVPPQKIMEVDARDATAGRILSRARIKNSNRSKPKNDEFGLAGRRAYVTHVICVKNPGTESSNGVLARLAKFVEIAEMEQKKKRM